MNQALQDSKDEGLSRVEITYTATTLQAEQHFFEPPFQEQAQLNLDAAMKALNAVDGICWHLPVRELFDGFVKHARGHQLLLVQKSVAAMIYASNTKAGCYTGFWQVKNPSAYFKYHEFLAAQALPGPNSRVTCVFQHHGPTGPTRF